MKSPELSVIIPAYNSAEFVGETINSVLSQTNDLIEIIVVNDGSTDDTAEILATFGDDICIIQQENRGLSAARNRGIEAAHGLWLAFLDADDLWLPGFFEEMLVTSRLAPEIVGVVCCGWRYANEHGEQIGVDFYPSQALDFSTFLVGNAFPVHAAIVRRKCAIEVGSFDVNLTGAEDWDFWLRIAQTKSRFQITKKPLVLYRQVADSMSRNILSHLDNGQAVLDKVFRYVDLDPGLREIAQEAYGNLHLWAGVGYCLADQKESGENAFVNALVNYPILLTKRATYFAIICADQPLEFKGTDISLDVDIGFKRVQIVLKKAFEASPSIDGFLQKRACSMAYLVKGEFAARKGQVLETGRCILNAISIFRGDENQKFAFRLLLLSVYKWVLQVSLEKPDVKLLVDW